MTELARRLDRMRRRHPRVIDLGLDRMRRVLSAMGDPQARLCAPSGRVVHIAGTNGKGSTLAYLRAMGAAAGRSVNSYTSPHLVRFNERIELHGRPIADSALLESLEAVEAANGDGDLSFFEATTAAALYAFAARPAELTLIEVGLGGRLDATNVIAPDLCVVTPVALDHREYLGADLASVAREKAGILKTGVPAVIGPQTEVALGVLEARATRLRAPASVWGRDFRAHAEQGRLVWQSESEVLDLPAPVLHGPHQTVNAGTAVAAARLVGLAPEAVARGLREARWPARLQSLTEGPYAEIVLEAGGELWLDGGHNPHAARALAHFMAEREGLSPRPLVLVMGILANKDAPAFLDAFAGLASGVVALGVPGHASLAPEVLAELASNRGITPTIAANLTDAVQRAVNMGEALSRDHPDQPIVPPRVLICGSLYLAGEVLRQGGVG